MLFWELAHLQRDVPRFGDLSDFLRFIESHHLKPGETIEVEARDEVSDSVRLKGRNDKRMTIGARAASKLLVQAA